MSNNDFTWKLPPAPGQYGAKQPSSQPPNEPTDETVQAPYGFRRMEKSGVGPFNPYIPTGQNPALRDRPMTELGMDDWVLRGMKGPGGTPDGMYVPQEQDLPGIFHNVTMEFGRWAPPSIAMPAIAGGRFYGTAMQLYSKQQVQQARIAERNAIASYKIANDRYKEMIGKYSNVFAQYGSSGKDDPGEPDKLHHALYEIAREYGDSNMKRLIEEQDYPAVEKLLRHLDHTASDNKKALQRLQIEREQQLIDKEKARLRDAQEREAPFRLHPSTTPSTGAPPAGSPAGATPATGGPQTGTLTDPATGKPIPIPEPPAETPDDPGLVWTDRPEVKPDATKPDQDHAPALTAPDDEKPSSEDATPSPASDTDTGDTADTSDDTSQQPTRVAQADIDVGGGAPARAAPEGPTPAPAADLTTRAKRPLVMAADDEAQARPQLEGRVREEPAPQVPQLPTADYEPLPSKALAGARGDGTGWDPNQVDQLAQKMVNGSIKIQDLRAFPPRFQNWAQSRRLEIEREMDRIANSNLEGEAVFQALNKINPEFSGVLRRYISGDFAIPASAWHNPSYLNRTLALGFKADHTFNGTNFAVRAGTKKSYAYGDAAKNITSIATLDRHAARMEADLEALKKYDPNFISGYLGATRLGNMYALRWLAGQPREVQQIMTRLGVDAETVSNEYQRAVTGGKPTVSGVHTDMSNLDWRWIGIDNAIDSARQRQAFAHERMKVLVDRYKAVVGRNEDALSRLYEGWAANPESRAGGLAPGSEIPDPVLDQDTLNDAKKMFRPQPGWKVEPIQ